MEMFRILLICALVGAGSALSCSWMERKYQEHRDSLLNQLNVMANSSISSNSTEDNLEDAVAFPNELYTQASKAVAEERARFVVLLLEEIFALFDEDQTFASWQATEVDDFLNVLVQQTDGLLSCIASQSNKKKNKKMNLYFMKLKAHVELKGRSAEAWEWIRGEVKQHLQQSDSLVLTKTN